MRKRERCGPVEMFELLMNLWRMHGLALEENPDENPARLAKLCVQAPYDESVLAAFLMQPNLSPELIAQKVKNFFKFYAANRHKANTLPVSYHAEGADANCSKYDWRPIVYPDFGRQFRQVDELVARTKLT